MSSFDELGIGGGIDEPEIESYHDLEGEGGESVEFKFRVVTKTNEDVAVREVEEAVAQAAQDCLDIDSAEVTLDEDDAKILEDTEESGPVIEWLGEIILKISLSDSNDTTKADIDRHIPAAVIEDDTGICRDITLSLDD
mgnify:CR=1 FL=1